MRPEAHWTNRRDRRAYAHLWEGHTPTVEIERLEERVKALEERVVLGGESLTAKMWDAQGDIRQLKQRVDIWERIPLTINKMQARLALAGLFFLFSKDLFLIFEIRNTLNLGVVPVVILLLLLDALSIVCFATALFGDGDRR